MRCLVTNTIHLDTSFFDPYPRSVDSTQHIDMWLQVIADDAVVISDWPFDQRSTQDLRCEAATSEMAARGYSVHRVPARSLGAHYTYTNVVMVNDLVIIPSYAHPDVVAHNDEALAAWEILAASDVAGPALQGTARLFFVMNQIDITFICRRLGRR